MARFRKRLQKGSVSNNKNFKWQDSLSYPYGRSFAKLYTVIKGEDISEYPSYVSNLNGTELLKLNLYPIAFRGIDDNLWKKYKLEAVTGFEDKLRYKIWCFHNRFEFFNDYLHSSDEPKPRLIICTGISFLNEFYTCFHDKQHGSEISSQKIDSKDGKGNSISRRFYWFKAHETVVAVLPFFSRTGLNSDDLLEKAGLAIRNLTAEA